MARRSRIGSLVRSVKYFETRGDAARARQFAEQLKALGRCVRCGRELSDPDSVARGLGPECAQRVAS